MPSGNKPSPKTNVDTDAFRHITSLDLNELIIVSANVKKNKTKKKQQQQNNNIHRVSRTGTILYCKFICGSIYNFLGKLCPHTLGQSCVPNILRTVKIKTHWWFWIEHEMKTVIKLYSCSISFQKIAELRFSFCPNNAFVFERPQFF